MKSLSLASSVALYTTQQITNIEQTYIELSANGSYPLMLRAGQAALEQLVRHWPNAKRILVVTGKGNNGGDGFVLAKLAIARRLKVDLCPLVEPNQLIGDALVAWQALPHKAIKQLSLQQIELTKYDLIVDAMLGTGIKGPLREPFNTIISLINQHSVPVLSLDIPSGVEADTGFVFDHAVMATSTISFVGHKKGMYTGDAGQFRGRVSLDRLQIPQAIFDQQPAEVTAQNWQSYKHKLKPRNITAHKGMFGHTVIIGGYRGMAGAAVLAATSAAKSGSGLTSAWVAEESARAINQTTPEVMALAIDENQIDQQVQQLKDKPRTLVFGPGLGKGSWANKWIDALSSQPRLNDVPQVWDADALNLLAELGDSHPNKYHSSRILTPHSGEAARLLGTNIDAIKRDRFAAASAISKRYGGLCILKGAGTIISDEKGLQVVCAVGNPGMASGGMGDVLAGLVGGLIAQKYSLMEAAILAVSIHGEAAELAAGPKKYYRGLLASDLFQYYPELLNPGC